MFLAALYSLKLTGINDRLQKRRKAGTIIVAAYFSERKKGHVTND